MHDADKINRFNKKNGELAEAYFAAACLERGWQIFTPHGDSDPYDAIIVKGVLLHTIQIKSTFPKKVDTNRSRWVISRGSKKKLKYDRGVDFFALYCNYQKCWRFIRPSRLLGRKTFSIKHSDVKTKNNWHELY